MYGTDLTCCLMNLATKFEKNPFNLEGQTWWESLFDFAELYLGNSIRSLGHNYSLILSHTCLHGL